MSLPLEAGDKVVSAVVYQGKVLVVTEWGRVIEIDHDQIRGHEYEVRVVFY